jgi:dihydroorotase
MTLTLPRWFDLHTHFRQGPAVADYIKAHLNMGCAGALAMPNTQPPVSRVSGPAQADSWSIESYSAELRNAGADAFEQLIVPLYLTRQSTVQMIQQGAQSGQLRACKYYPPHGTTNAEHGMPMDDLIGGEVLRAMEDHGIILCIHGEQHALSGPDYIDAAQNAETRFYQERMPRLIETHPRLRIVCEHITTRTAAAFVAKAPDHIGATITPQHLLYTIGHLIQGLKYHLYCLPVVKFQDDRAALREQVVKPGQSKFFAGTDSAPHTTKATACGCAAGCFTGGIAPQLYAMAFEEAGVNLFTPDGQSNFERFLSLNGPAFYQFPASSQHFQMTKSPSQASLLKTPSGDVTPLSVGLGIELAWQITV